MAYSRNFRARARSGYNRARSGFRRYGTRSNAIASMPYLIGAGAGFTGIVDRFVPANLGNLIMIAAVAPSSVMKGKALGQLKAVSQGYLLGKIVRSIVPGLPGNLGGNSGGNVI